MRLASDDLSLVMFGQSTTSSAGTLDGSSLLAAGERAGVDNGCLLGCWLVLLDVGARTKEDKAQVYWCLSTQRRRRHKVVRLVLSHRKEEKAQVEWIGMLLPVIGQRCGKDG